VARGCCSLTRKPPVGVRRRRAPTPPSTPRVGPGLHHPPPQPPGALLRRPPGPRHQGRRRAPPLGSSWWRRQLHSLLNSLLLLRQYGLSRSRWTDSSRLIPSCFSIVILPPRQLLIAYICVEKTWIFFLFSVIE
jgi:hypothetical protein